MAGLADLINYGTTAYGMYQAMPSMSGNYYNAPAGGGQQIEMPQLPVNTSQQQGTPSPHVGSYNYTQPNPGTGLNWGNGYQGLQFGSQPQYSGGMSMQGPQVGGQIYAPGYGQAQARMAQQQYQQAYQQAYQQNLQRMNQVAGMNNPLNQLPTRTAPAGGSTALSGIPGVGGKGSVQEVQIGGKWKRLDEVTPQDTQAINAMIARNSQFEPLSGGYYGRYARGMNDVAGMSNITDYMNQRGTTAQNMIGGMQGVANQYGQRTQTGQDLLGGLYPVAQQYGQRTQTGMGITDQLNNVVDQYGQRTAQGMNMVQNLGLQQRNDINRQYDNLAHGETSDLAARGLGNSTVASGVRQAAEADRAQALGRLHDQLSQQQLSTFSDLSGQQLGAAMQVPQIQAQNYANLSGQQLQFAGQIPQLMAQNYGQLSGQQLGYAGEIPQAQTNAYLQTSGQTADWMKQYGQLGLNTDAQLSGDMLKMVENVQQPYPNAAAYQNVAQQGMNYDGQAALLAQLRQYYGAGGGAYG